MEIVSKLLLEEKQKERQKKRQAQIIHLPPLVNQSMARKQREQRQLQDLLPLSAHSEREVEKAITATKNISVFYIMVLIFILIAYSSISQSQQGGYCVFPI